MRRLVTALLISLACVPVYAQRRGAGGSATLAIFVSDPAGAAVSNVLVTAEGPTRRTVRTEGGRIALEGLPPGAYRLRFDREGFVPLERELTARGGAPIEVKVTLTPLPPPPPPPPAPVEPVKPPSAAKPAVVDLLAVIDKNFVGRAPSKTSPISCGEDIESTLIQLNQPIAEHAHNDSDEVFYVVAGEGAANYEGQTHRLKAGTYVFVPRGMPHSLAQSGRNPLIVLSMRTGGCS